MEENANCPVDASKQKKKKKKKDQNWSFSLGGQPNEKYKVLNGDKEKRYWNLSSLEKCLKFGHKMRGNLNHIFLDHLLLYFLRYINAKYTQECVISLFLYRPCHGFRRHLDEQANF